MTGNMDISKIISLIMENPKLIAEISSLAKGEGESTQSELNVPEKENEAAPEVSISVSEEKDSAPASAIIHERSHGTRNRSQLLGALKPYVSKERAQAIDSMLSIVEILDVMKGR